MNPTIKTLTAVAALTLAAGVATAQDTQTVPLAQPDDQAVTAPESGTSFVVNPDGSREVLSADEAEDEATTEDEDAVAAQAEAEDDTIEEEADQDVAAEDSDDADLAAADEDEADTAEVGDEATAGVDEAAEDEAADEDVAAAEPDDEAADEEFVEDEPAAEPEQQITDVAFSFEGPFGRYDSLQLQRGLQVYTEICAACHGLQYVPIRTLSDPTGPNMPEDQVRAFAAEYDKYDPDLDEDVPREPSDNFPHVPEDEGMGPDLSLMAKARAGFHGPYGTGINQLFNGIGGPEYIYSILTHYTGETKEEAGTTLYENTAFPGGWISMPPPIFDESLDFEDGHPNDLNSISREVSAFLMWAAEPKMMQRKQMGTVSVLFLLVLSVLLYLTNRRLWLPHKHPRKED